MRENSLKELSRWLKEEAIREKSVINESFEDVTGIGQINDDQLIEDPVTEYNDVEEELGLVPEDPNEPYYSESNYGEVSVEQKKVLLIEYYSKLINKVVIVRDHIDSISFDSAVSNNVNISTSELQFSLETLKTKIERYIEDQYETDKYERSLYIYLSFMEELKLIVKLLQKQQNKIK